MLKLATLVYVKRPGQTLMLHRIKKANDMHAGKWNGLDRIFLPWLDDDRFFSGNFLYVDGKHVEHSVVFYPIALVEQE